MTKGDFAKYLTDSLKEYYKYGVLRSIKNNRHMNKFTGDYIDDEATKAILVDFINLLCYKQGIDLAMYTSDLKVAPTIEEQLIVADKIEQYLETKV
jgi:hypothetical protein